MVKGLVPQTVIEQRIFIIRGHKVMVDRDLAELYGVETKQLTRQVRRNIGRFPEDFMFLLTNKEVNNLRCQIGTSSWGGRRYRSYAFAEQGVAMLSSILNSERAVRVNIAIMRTFVKLREMISLNKDLSYKLNELEKKMEKHDKEIIVIFRAIRELIREPEEKQKKGIGFHVKYD